MMTDRWTDVTKVTGVFLQLLVVNAPKIIKGQVISKINTSIWVTLNENLQDHNSCLLSKQAALFKPIYAFIQIFNKVVFTLYLHLNDYVF
jgi:hypothetical protein